MNKSHYYPHFTDEQNANMLFAWSHIAQVKVIELILFKPIRLHNPVFTCMGRGGGEPAAVFKLFTTVHISSLLIIMLLNQTWVCFFVSQELCNTPRGVTLQRKLYLQQMKSSQEIKSKAVAPKLGSHIVKISLVFMAKYSIL